MGAITVSHSPPVSNSMPTPPNFPSVSPVKSSNSFGGKYSECGSSSATIPLMAPWSRRVRSTGSTYRFSTCTSTLASCSMVACGESSRLSACAIEPTRMPPTNDAAIEPTKTGRRRMRAV
jgi:hypothetical protein